MTLTDYISRERKVEAARLAHHTREVARTGGGGWSAMGPGPFVARTDAQIVADATAKYREACAWEVSPKGRFLIAVTTTQNRAGERKDQALWSACERARECASRGLEDGLDHAGRCLDTIASLGGDVTEARAALADVAAPVLMMAGE